MLKKTLMATAITLAALSAQAQTVLLTEGFDDISTLTASGWVQTNLSSPVGNGWFQGYQGPISAQSGPAGSYIGADFLTSTTGSIANWLISPTFSTAVAGVVSFWANAAIDPGFSDQIAFGLNTGSSSTSAFTLGSPITLTGGWTEYSVSFAAQGAGSVGRFAIEYLGTADTANFVGIDTFAVTTLATAPVPEPSTYALMALGLAAVAVVGRRRTTA